MCSFAACSSNHIYADPTDEEETLSTGTVTIVVTRDKKLVSVHKPGMFFFSDHIYILHTICKSFYPLFVTTIMYLGINGHQGALIYFSRTCIIKIGQTFSQSNQLLVLVVSLPNNRLSDKCRNTVPLM